MTSSWIRQFITSSTRQLLMLALLPAAALTISCSTQSISNPAPVDIKPDNTLPAGVHSDPTQWKLVWLMTNFVDDKQVEHDIELARRAAKAGYTHMVVSDVKFMKWDFMGPHYAQNVQHFMTECHKVNLKVWACCAPMGYANSLLMRNPNLAEGLPVEGDFIVEQSLNLKPYDPDLKLQNGDFQTTRQWAKVYDGPNPSAPKEFTSPTDWTSSNFGISVFIDKDVQWNGKPTLRIDPAPPRAEVSGEAAAARESSYAPGVSQSIDVKPFHYYHVHAMIKTEGKSLKRATQIAVNADDPKHLDDKTILNYQTPLLPATTDWQEFDMTFNSLEYSRVKLTLPGRQSRGGGGAGEQGSGSVHWADITIEPGQFVNIIRRDGAPLEITKGYGGTQKILEPVIEGKDLTPVVDPLLGRDPGAGTYTIWHHPPAITLIPGSRLHYGDIIHAHYYVPALVHSDQVMCCMADPGVYDILKWEIHNIHTLMNPDGYFMGHDELRSQGYDKSCVDSGKSMHELLADNVRRITHFIKTEDPGKDICTWSDLFDPFHNAKNDGKRYYLVKGVSPWYGAWTGLDPDVIIMNWHGPFDGNQTAAVKFFSDQGHRQILSGYYDKPIEPFRTRLDNASHFPGVVGSMYTTWTSNFDLMEPFARLCDEWKAAHPTSAAEMNPRTGDHNFVP